jgi:hypothetical protein
MAVAGFFSKRSIVGIVCGSNCTGEKNGWGALKSSTSQLTIHQLHPLNSKSLFLMKMSHNSSQCVCVYVHLSVLPPPPRAISCKKRQQPELNISSLISLFFHSIGRAWDVKCEKIYIKNQQPVNTALHIFNESKNSFWNLNGLQSTEE